MTQILKLIQSVVITEGNHQFILGTILVPNYLIENIAYLCLRFFIKPSNLRLSLNLYYYSRNYNVS